MAQEERVEPMPAPPAATPPARTGATDAGPHHDLEHRGRAVWWLVGAAGVAIGIVWAVAAGGGSGGSTAASTPGPDEVTTSSGRDVLPLATDATALAGLEGQTVQARAVPVQGFVPGAGFWIGTASDRLFVGDPVSGSFGDGALVDLTGVVRALPSDFKSAFGVEVPQTARLLGREGVYIVTGRVTPIGT